MMELNFYAHGKKGSNMNASLMMNSELNSFLATIVPQSWSWSGDPTETSYGFTNTTANGGYSLSDSEGGGERTSRSGSISNELFKGCVISVIYWIAYSGSMMNDSTIVFELKYPIEIDPNLIEFTTIKIGSTIYNRFDFEKKIISSEKKINFNRALEKFGIPNPMPINGNPYLMEIV